MNDEKLPQLTQLQEKLKYFFRDINLLAQALTHRSYANENPLAGMQDNERMEFLGDAALGLCISDLLTRKYENFDEGALSKIRSLLVNEKPLAELATKLELGNCLLLGRGEERSGGRAKESLLANALEAVVAAIYLDGGFCKTKTVVKRLMSPLIKDALNNSPYFDYKTSLQEYCQKNFKCAPSYTIIAETGPDHNKTFEIELTAGKNIQATGRGKSKKEAQKQAAQKAWEYLQHENDS